MGLGEFVRSFSRHRSPIDQMKKHEIIGRFHGPVSGLLRPFLNPLLAFYIWVFSAVSKTRWNMGSNSGMEFATLRVVGLIIHRFGVTLTAIQGVFRSPSVANAG